MQYDPSNFFAAALAAGSILTGFCGTFLSFRIQREANYYRQPVLDFHSQSARDVYIGLTHFTSAFLLLSMGAFLAVVFGFALPLMALAGATWISASPVVGGILASLVLVLAYFLNEMVHYGVLNTNLINDAKEWRRGRALLAVAFIIAVGVFFAGWILI